MSTPDQMPVPFQQDQPGVHSLPGPQLPPQVPVTGVVDDDTDEREARDVLAVELAQSAASMAKAAQVAQGSNAINADAAAKAAESYAHAALYMTQAHILIAPLEAADDLTQNAGTAAPSAPSASSSTSSGA